MYPRKEEYLPVGARVLIFHQRPPQAVKKLYQNWKGVFVVKKKIDKYTYVVCPGDQRRKKLIVYRGRIRRLGSSLPESLENETGESLEEGAEGVSAKDRAVVLPAGDNKCFDQTPTTGRDEKPELRRSGWKERINYHQFYLEEKTILRIVTETR